MQGDVIASVGLMNICLCRERGGRVETGLYLFNNELLFCKWLWGRSISWYDVLCPSLALYFSALRGFLFRHIPSMQ